ncbi:hypothetical protein EZV61_06900 [Corallincola luteus]|uniref:Uncharacterized protein n=3 Tax=Corallincola TaxID=1775176 RepID=A0A368NNH9_9GAMM|nr:hypothetical protein DU002_05915 [Corallincola holothuriorum]TAA45820.1 hypothetical protein EXY25_10705 [Corallincola spongiicola]TCI03917.1 hypothetical protein EZV61_06900 [Corallincola luteus]
MGKQICKWDRRQNALMWGEPLLELVKKPKFVCKKCFRVASDKSVLCKSVKLKSLSETGLA